MTKIISGDWEFNALNPGERWAHAYEAAVVGPTWNGWEQPFFTRCVAAQFVARQEALAEAHTDVETDRWAWDGDTIVVTSQDFPEGDRIEPRTVEGFPEPVYSFWLGYCFTEVPADKVDNVHRIGQ